MSDLSSHGWRVEGAAAEDMSEVDMKAMFVDADFQRRNSSELMVPPPRKVTNSDSLTRLLKNVFGFAEPLK